MSFFQAVVLGIVQGATEFLPISSSGHLVLVPWLLGWSFEPQAAFIFDVLVQWGTLAAVIWYFRKDLLELASAAVRGLSGGSPWKEHEARLAWLIIAASVPAAAAGYFLKDAVASTFDNPAAASGFLLGTAALLFLSEFIRTKERNMESAGLIDAIWIGMFQILALFPGISRSGSTIAGGLLRGFSRRDAARFSFLMSIPIMLGAGMLAILDLGESGNSFNQLPTLLVGAAAAAIVGYLSIRWLLSFISTHSLKPFAWYCLAVGTTGLLIHVL